jgi:hypothetical protein
MGGRNLMPLFYASRGSAARMGRAGRALSAGRPLLAAAVRIPERVSSQLALVFPATNPQLFVHEGARQSLERRLMAAFPGPVVLSITDNRHSIITHRCKDGVLRVRLHHMFLDAPPNVVEALVRYITRGDRDASTLVGLYIEANGARVNRRPRNLRLVSRGEHHDLLAIFQKLNERYFDGAVHAVITWGKRATVLRPRRKTIKLGSYSAVERIIRVHPALDRKWVPSYFVQYIVYHEMLHHVIPASRGTGRTMLHPPEFRESEKLFRQYERSIVWEKRHIGRLLRG